MGVLLDALREAGADEQAAALLARDPAAHVALDDPYAVAWLRDSLQAVGADDQAAIVAARAAAHVPLDHPDAVARLLACLQEAGADEQAAMVAARVSLDDPYAVAWLLDSLQAAGADEQAVMVVGRLPAVGMFSLFLEQHGSADQFRFGREADGTPAAPWSWEDLNLWLVSRLRGP